MKDRETFKAQLFHTYTTGFTERSRGRKFLDGLLNGHLSLPPHQSQDIGLNPDWTEDPLDDANWCFQFHCLVWLDRLRAESLSLDSKEGLKHYEMLLRSWLRLNPVDSSASNYSWFDMAVGMRAIVLLFAVEHFGNEAWLVDSLREHGQHLADPSNYEGRGNHGLHQDMGLIAVGHYFESDEWVQLAQFRIETMFEDAVDEEGVCREGSIDYQYNNYVWYQEAAFRILAATGKPSSFIEERLARMPSFLAHATSPSGKYALIGDTLSHRAPTIRGTEAEWIVDHKKAPESRVARYTSGYVFARNRWATWREDKFATFLSMRFGPGRATAVHGHEDAGSVTLDSLGERLLHDSGLYAYQGGEFRLHFRSRAAHNVIDVAGRKYYPSAESPLVSYMEKDGHVLSTVLIKGLEGVAWHRTILFSLDDFYLLVDDRVKNLRVSPVFQRWQLPKHARIMVDSESLNVESVTAEGNVLNLSPLAYNPEIRVAQGGRSPIMGWRSDDYRRMYSTPELSFSLVGESLRFSTLISFAEKGSGEIVRSGAVSRTSDYLDVTLRRPNWSRRVRLSSTDFSVS